MEVKSTSIIQGAEGIPHSSARSIPALPGKAGMPEKRINAL
jgi:hypothetical protein